MKEVRNEAELLICCARTTLDSAQAEKIKRLLQGEIDWAFLLRMASKHGLRPLLYYHLHTISPESVPETTLVQLEEYFHRNCYRNLLLMGELLKLLNLFATQGIDAIPYKGPTLALAAYGNLALRESGDLDILVRSPDVRRVAEMLKSEGYRCEYELDVIQEATFLRHQYHRCFRHSERRITVEIHWEFEKRYFSLPLDPESMRTRLQPFSLSGRQISVYSTEDIFLLLCIHGTKHLWERLRWVCDLAEMIRIYQKMDWERIIAQARESRCERMLWLGVYLAHKLLDVSFPPEVIEKMAADPSIKSLAARVESRLDIEGHDPGIFQITHFLLKARTHWRDRARFGIGLMVTPTGVDLEALPLPLSLSPLYSVVRLARLTAKYCLGLSTPDRD